MRVPPPEGPSRVEWTQMNIHVPVSRSRWIDTDSPSQAASSSSMAGGESRESPWAKRFSVMATKKQSTAAKRNIKKAASAAKSQRTIAHLPKKTRTALGKQANKVKRQKARST